jgi:hypothetical protein
MPFEAPVNVARDLRMMLRDLLDKLERCARVEPVKALDRALPQAAGAPPLASNSRLRVKIAPTFRHPRSHRGPARCPYATGWAVSAAWSITQPCHR